MTTREYYSNPYQPELRWPVARDANDWIDLCHEAGTKLVVVHSDQGRGLYHQYLDGYDPMKLPIAFPDEWGTPILDELERRGLVQSH